MTVLHAADCSHRYIFVNMFTGVVVESFAYVYQMPGGSSLNREEMRECRSVVAVSLLIGFLQVPSRRSGRSSILSGQAISNGKTLSNSFRSVMTFTLGSSD